MPQVIEAIWNHFILNWFSYIPRDCNAEFSKIFTENILISCHMKKKLLFETSFTVAETLYSV